MELIIQTKTQLADGIVQLELVHRAGIPLPVFTAGAHIDLHLGNGMARSYSLLNDQSQRHRYVVAINLDPHSRGGSRWIHEEARIGQSIQVAGPRNHFPLVEDARHVVLIAGGIGITPLLSMIRRLEALNRRWTLHYSVRSRRQCAFVRELQELGSARGNVHLHIVDERGGRLPDLDALVAAAPEDAHLYCCGPAPMLHAFERASAARPAGTTHVEYFSAQQDAAVGGGFDVVLARSGCTLRVEPGSSILDTVLAQGIDVGHACKEGICGACQTRVLEGQPDHRDSYLSPREKSAGDSIMLCCSGSLSPALVLDL